MDGLIFKEAHKPLKGIFELDAIKNGKVIEHTREENLIVDGARVQMAHLISGDAEDREITRIAFGTDGTAPAATDTEITDAFEKEVSGCTFPEAGHVKFSWSLAASEDNGQAIMEFGLLCADGALFARRTRANPIYKESDIALQGSWEIIF
jgi:hypothetical protein